MIVSHMKCAFKNIQCYKYKNINSVWTIIRHIMFKETSAFIKESFKIKI